MKHRSAITRTASAVIIIVLIVVAGGGIYYYSTGTSPSSTTTTSMTTTPAAPVTISFYEALAPSEMSFMTNTIIPQFEQANPSITVQLVNEPQASQVATSVEALVKGNDAGTTLVGIDNLVVGELIAGNDLMDLSSSVSSMEPSGLISSAQSMISYEKTVYNNAIYFLPFRSNIPLTFYSKAAFTKAGISSPPTTTTQLVSDLQALQTAGYQTPIMIQGGGRDASAPTELYQWIVQFGGNPFLLNDSGSLKAFQFLQGLQSYYASGYDKAYWGTYVGLSGGTYQVLDYQWPYVYNLLTNSTLGMTDSTLGVYPGPAGPTNGNHLLGGDVLVVPKGATNIGAIEKFANFLLSANPQKEMLLKESWVAVNSQAYQNLPANFTAVGQALQQAISTGVFLRNPAPWISQWNTIAYDAFTKVVIDNASPSSIQGILNTENQQMYQYLVTNFGQSTAQQYEQNVFKPISVS